MDKVTYCGNIPGMYSLHTFCYLTNVLGAGGSTKASTIARILNGWRKFRASASINVKRTFLVLEWDDIYSFCVMCITVGHDS